MINMKYIRPYLRQRTSIKCEKVAAVNTVGSCYSVAITAKAYVTQWIKSTVKSSVVSPVQG